jgi:hypothetical protein
MDNLDLSHMLYFCPFYDHCFACPLVSSTLSNKVYCDITVYDVLISERYNGMEYQQRYVWRFSMIWLPRCTLDKLKSSRVIWLRSKLSIFGAKRNCNFIWKSWRYQWTGKTMIIKRTKIQMLIDKILQKNLPI